MHGAGLTHVDVGVDRTDRLLLVHGRLVKMKFGRKT